MKFISQNCQCIRVVEGIRGDKSHRSGAPPAGAPPAGPPTPVVTPAETISQRKISCNKFNKKCPKNHRKVKSNNYFSSATPSEKIDACCQVITPAATVAPPPSATPAKCYPAYTEDSPEGPVKQPADNTELNDVCGPKSDYFKNMKNPKLSDCKKCARKLSSCTTAEINDYCS